MAQPCSSQRRGPQAAKAPCTGSKILCSPIAPLLSTSFSPSVWRVREDKRRAAQERDKTTCAMLLQRLQWWELWDWSEPCTTEANVRTDVLQPMTPLRDSPELNTLMFDFTPEKQVEGKRRAYPWKTEADPWLQSTAPAVNNFPLSCNTANAVPKRDDCGKAKNQKLTHEMSFTYLEAAGGGKHASEMKECGKTGITAKLRGPHLTIDGLAKELEKQKAHAAALQVYICAHETSGPGTRQDERDVQSHRRLRCTAQQDGRIRTGDIINRRGSKDRTGSEWLGGTRMEKGVRRWRVM